MKVEMLTDRLLKSKVELGSDETVLDRGYFWHRARWWLWTQGMLYLTSRRLIWMRGAPMPPLGPRLIEIALGDVKSCGRRRPPLNLRRALVVETVDGGTHWFFALWPVEGAWCEAISKAVTEAEAT